MPSTPPPTPPPVPPPQPPPTPPPAPSPSPRSSPQLSAQSFAPWQFLGLERSLAIAVVLSFAIGIALRFYNLGLKVYWFDETMTLLRVSGWNQAQWVAAAFDGLPIAAGEFVATYQYPSPDLPWSQTIDALATHPEHSPLYYLAVRLWCAIGPHSVGFVRQLSAWIGVLVLPLMYWLARELFTDRRMALLATALAAIAPVHVHYAQEAREYSLWTVAIVFATAALVRALRSSVVSEALTTEAIATGGGWWLYGLGVALLLYSHPFSAFVLLSHGFYAFYCAWKRRRWQPLAAYMAASFTGLLAFVPWLWVVLQNFSEFLQNTQHTSEPLKTPLLLYWGLNLSRIFLDFNQGTSPLNPTLYLFLGIAIAATVSLWRHERQDTAIALLTLMGVMALGLMVPDLIHGGRRSHNIRYFLPCVIGLQLAVAAWLARHLDASQSRQIRRRWRNGTIALLVVGALSIAVSSQMEVWWTKSASKSKHHPQIARIVNAARLGVVIDDANARDRAALTQAIAAAQASNRPPRLIAIVSDETSGQILSLSHSLAPEIALIFTPPGIAPDGLPNYDHVFLYRSSEALHAAIAARDNVQFVQHISWLDEAIGQD